MRIYNYFFENILLNFFCFLLSDPFLRELKKIRKIVRKSERDLIKLQREKIYKLLKYSVDNVPFYSDLKLDSHKINIKSFPIIDKNTLREHQNRLLSKKIKSSKLIKHVSSGSSGVQSIVYWTKYEQAIHRATQLLWWEWSGYKMGQPILQTGINPQRSFIKKVKDFVFKTRYVQAFSHSEDDVTNALNWAKRKNVFFAGYASSLYVFSQIAEKIKIDVSFQGAVSWGDKLFKHYKSSILKNFRTDVKETYASAEGLMIAAQKDLDYMYLMTPNVFVEILDNDGNEVNDGEIGNVIVTNLNSFAMPLIRYKIGDLAIKLPKNKYPKKREINLPILQKVIGRDTDIVLTDCNKLMVVHSFTGIFEHYPQIRQFCVIQENIKGIKIEIIVGSDFNNIILDEIKKKIRSYTNEKFEIKFQEVNKIEPTPSGKPQIIVSKLENKFINSSRQQNAF